MEKTIKISQEAYKRLITSKNKGETLTDVILREIKPNPNQKTMMNLFGTWQGETEEFEKIFGAILDNQLTPNHRITPLLKPSRQTPPS